MDLLSIPEVAAIRGVDRTTAWRWVNSGALPSIRVGANGRAVRRSDLAKFEPTPPGRKKLKKSPPTP